MPVVTFMFAGGDDTIYQCESAAAAPDIGVRTMVAHLGRSAKRAGFFVWPGRQQGGRHATVCRTLDKL
ncbi:MAG: hypothetical protein BZY88_17555 [SAR202 cluster bacterium Io17-Chloro-G9]|nr:MAG: hypothetical protein BZY88_17555 [SAR202 cluster bacterium Io17-Chloro-G9]